MSTGGGGGGAGGATAPGGAPGPAAGARGGGGGGAAAGGRGPRLPLSARMAMAPAGELSPTTVLPEAPAGKARGQAGSIELVLGPMFAGKSTELARRMRRHTAAQRRCLVLKYAKDVRYSQECMTTHDQTKVGAVPVCRLAEVDAMVRDFDVVGIDEGQFYEDLVEYCEAWANAGKMVIVAALDGTFQRKAFNRVLELVPLAEDVRKLKAVCCVCHKDAAFTLRIGDETELEVIGGAEKYLATCRACYIRGSGGPEPEPESAAPGKFSKRAGGPVPISSLEDLQDMLVSA